MATIPGAADAADATLIPRTALFGNPVKTQARLSPGRQIRVVPRRRRTAS